MSVQASTPTLSTRATEHPRFVRNIQFTLGIQASKAASALIRLCGHLLVFSAFDISYLHACAYIASAGALAERLQVYEPPWALGVGYSGCSHSAWVYGKKRAAMQQSSSISIHSPCASKIKPASSQHPPCPFSISAQHPHQQCASLCSASKHPCSLLRDRSYTYAIYASPVHMARITRAASTR